MDLKNNKYHIIKMIFVNYFIVKFNLANIYKNNILNNLFGVDIPKSIKINSNLYNSEFEYLFCVKTDIDYKKILYNYDLEYSHICTVSIDKKYYNNM